MKIEKGEVRSMLNLSLKLNYITEEQYKKFSESSIKISKLISGFIKTL